jgi:hypothetical protein
MSGVCGTTIVSGIRTIDHAWAPISMVLAKAGVAVTQRNNVYELSAFEVHIRFARGCLRTARAL